MYLESWDGPGHDGEPPHIQPTGYSEERERNCFKFYSFSAG